MLLAVSGAWGQYSTPARVTWTDNPETTALVQWDRPAPGRGTVRYGTTTNYTHAAHDGGGTYRHEVRLIGLAPGTRYYYEASSTDGYAQEGAFRTMKAAGEPLHFVFHGDLQGALNESGAQGVADRIVLEDPEFIVSLGDMAEEAFSGSGFETWEQFFRICSNELARAAYMPTMGNHDAAPGSDFTRGLYHRLFALPEPSKGPAVYSWTAGTIRFIVLNTEIDGAEQVEWLSRELQSAVNDTNIIWVIATCHRPPYSWGERAGDSALRDNHELHARGA